MAGRARKVPWENNRGGHQGRVTGAAQGCAKHAAGRQQQDVQEAQGALTCPA